MRLSSLLSSPFSLKRSMDISVNSCKTPSLQRWCQLSWLHSTFLFLVLSPVFSQTSVSSSPTQLSYSNHCASIVPESTQTQPEFTTSRLTDFTAGYFTGGNAILDQNSSSYSSGFSKSLTFRTQSLHSTKIKGVFKIEGSLVLSSDGTY